MELTTRALTASEEKDMATLFQSIMMTNYFDRSVIPPCDTLSIFHIVSLTHLLC
jgi:hypothetical protein